MNYLLDLLLASKQSKTRRTPFEATQYSSFLLQHIVEQLKTN